MIELTVCCKDKDEAIKISEVLIKDRLAACINYFPVDSIYLWKGKVENSKEYMLIIKTSESKKDSALKKIKELHSYELPIITIAKKKLSKKDEKWIEESTK